MRLPLVVPVVDLLGDHRETEQSETIVEVEAIHIEGNTIVEPNQLAITFAPVAAISAASSIPGASLRSMTIIGNILIDKRRPSLTTNGIQLVTRNMAMSEITVHANRVDDASDNPLRVYGPPVTRLYQSA